MTIWDLLPIAFWAAFSTVATLVLVMTPIMACDWIADRLSYRAYKRWQGLLEAAPVLICLALPLVAGLSLWGLLALV